MTTITTVTPELVRAIEAHSTPASMARSYGLVCVGEWGDGVTAGGIYCLQSDREAVQRAYDAIEDGDSGPDVLDGVRAAGGAYIRC